MLRFSYTARTREGTTLRGSIDAADRAAAETALEERGYLSVQLRAAPQFLVRLEDVMRQFRRPRTKDVVVFLRQFSVMVGAKLPMVTALRSLVHQTKSAPLRAILFDIVRDVESGRRLSDALATHPRTFGSFAIYLVRAGETSGRIEEVLSYLADQSEHDEELRSRVRGAMIYPAFILGGLGTVSFIMMTFVVPKLTGVLQEAGVQLPWTTRALIAVSGFFGSWWWLILIGIVAAAIAFRVALRYPVPRKFWDSLTLRTPIFGVITREVATVRFARSFEMLLRGGVDVIPALEVVSGVLGNAAYQALIAQTIREVRDGNAITTVLRTSSLMPSMATQLLTVGEETGQLSEVLGRISQHFERIVDQRVRNLVTVIEPFVMILLGLAVGVMVSAILLPMYNLASGG
ncbi:type II secretion system F family protein [Candidatus Uhrbacteria bacterium]|nr:type II secretion system F family protein [Candidatus Uhrbacteria bacterium]